MTTETLPPQALSIIDKYLHFQIGSGICSVPYFNNKTTRARAALRSVSGKGSPQEITEEIQALIIKDHADVSNITSENLKKILTDHNIGIDCSAFAYYVLNALSEETKHVSLKNKINFNNSKGLISKIRSALRPIENCDVATLANDANSTVINISDVKPGDIITMTDGPNGDERNHILVIHKVERNDGDNDHGVTRIYYSHAVAYPEDGIYGTGIKQGTIDTIKNRSDSGNPALSKITDFDWTENNKTGNENHIYIRATKSRTELRRLNVFHNTKGSK